MEGIQILDVVSLECEVESHMSQMTETTFNTQKQL